VNYYSTTDWCTCQTVVSKLFRFLCFSLLAFVRILNLVTNSCLCMHFREYGHYQQRAEDEVSAEGKSQEGSA
jgi:hypothetical protein